MADWELSMAYDYRFGIVGLRLHKDEGGEEATFAVSLRDLLTHLQVKPHELQAIMQPEYKGTEGGQDIELARRRLLEETDLQNKTVLDIGGYDGWAAKRCLDQGAAQAICLDNHQYEHYGWQEKKYEGVKYVQGDFMGIGNPDHPAWIDSLYDVGFDPFDVIIFYNVLYHLKNPWAALDHLRTLLKPDGEMLLCTLFRYSDQPTWHLYEPLECNSTDRTVFWGPSLLGLERMLRFTGWEAERYALAFDRVLYRCKPIQGFESDLSKEGYAKS